MDSIIEFLIEKEREAKDIVLKTLIFVLMIVLCLISFATLGSFGLLGAALIVLLGVKIQDMFNIEYEYCILNADIDIDRIYAKKRRKRYVSLEGASIELIAPVNSDELKSISNENIKKLYACKNKNDTNNYVIVGYTSKGGRVAVYIENDQKIIEQFKKYIPRKVIL